MRLLRPIAFLVSVTLHLAVFGPALVAGEPPLADDEPVDLDDLALADGEEDGGDLPIEPLPDVPFRVSLYAEPAPAPTLASTEAPPEASATGSADVVEAPLVPLVPPPTAPEEPEEVAVAVPAPEPPPAPPTPPVEPLPEVPLTEEDRTALAAMEQGEANGEVPATDLEEADDPPAIEAGPKRTRQFRHARVHTDRKHKSKQKPCPEAPEGIARVADAHWYIDRDLIEYYATNLRELQKLGSVWTHRDTGGKLDGFAVRLSRCSVLRQGGLRSGDVVHDVNGRRIHSVLQAVAAYMALRAEPELKVRVTRRGEPVVLSYTIEQPEKRQRVARKR